MAQINKSNEYFNTILWTGDDTNDRAITGVGFQPDWCWIKKRAGTGLGAHVLFDVIRGADNYLVSNTTGAEGNTPSLFDSFDSDGFTVSYNSNESTNGDGTYVGWNWLAGGTAVSNTDGDMTSSVSANTTSGFSIATYTGDGVNGSTFGHGLGVAPKVVIIKTRSLGTEDWHFWYNNSTRLNLNNTNAGSAISPISTSSTLVTTPSSTNDSWNGSGQTYVSYCFAEKKGFSKFGSYTGNGSTDGTFVYTGFKPAYFMIKRTDSTGSWIIHDNKRSFYNVTSHDLYANLSDAEVSGNRFDFVSNGVKLRNNITNMNASGGTYIYMAFAENPLVGTNNIPATAR